MLTDTTLCPWCDKITLTAKMLKIGDVKIIISPQKCSFCGAEEISIYSLADGKRPNLTEIEKGYYKGVKSS